MQARSLLGLSLLLAATAPGLQARTVYRCLRDGSISLATAPEPGSRCTAVVIDDNAAKLPNLWGTTGVHQGTLYERVQDGQIVYSTRLLPGSVKVLGFTVSVPADAQAHAGLGALGPPQLDVHALPFRRAARETGVDEAWLRAIAHIESGFDANARSPKGAQGVMQLMPTTATELGVTDPYAADQSIRAGARQLRALQARYHRDWSLVAAAYNAGIGTVTRYGGVPPYAETQDYVARVLALHEQYRAALAARAAKAAARHKQKRR